MSSVVYHIVLVIFAGLLLAGATSDARRLLIPNQICLSIAILYPAHVLTVGSGVEWAYAIAIAAATLVVGFLLFAVRYVGGGDVKFLSATILWAGAEYLVPFWLVMSLTGGGLAVVIWGHNRFVAIRAPAGVPTKPIAARPIPYGIAIAAGGIWVALTKFQGG